MSIISEKQIVGKLITLCSVTTKDEMANVGGTELLS